MASSPSETQRTALVIGATGGLGGEVTKALNAHGWHVRALTRRKIEDESKFGWLGPVEWIVGDAMNSGDVIAAAWRASIVFHGANPPGYRDWRGLAIPMLANSIAAAQATGVRLIFPGNVYNYGPDAFPVLTESSPQHPCSEKGAVRVDMEKMLQQAALQGVRSLVVRAGDFFGPNQPASWFKDLMVKPGKQIASVVYPGDAKAGHAWAYLPDLAETIARIADIERTLPDFDTFHFAGQWLENGDEMAKAILRVAGKPDGRIKPAPWLMFRLLSPFVTFLREALEMRYLWQKPARLDNSKLRALLGTEPHTQLDQAVAETLRALGCLPAT